MVEFMQLFPIQAPFESFTNVEAEHPNVDIFPFVRHRVLDRYQRAAQHRRSGEDGTLIIVRRTLTEPKATTAGVMPAISFARFRDTMATFNIEKTLSRPFVGWDLEAIELKSGGSSSEEMARRDDGVTRESQDRLSTEY